MPVFRVERNKGYTAMSNYHLQDKSLSLKAKGLMSQIFSLPEDWDYTLPGLCYINRESKDAIRSAVNELEQARYIERHQTTDESDKFSSNEYIIHEQPVSLPPSLDNLYTDKAKGILSEQRFVKLTVTMEREQEENQKQLKELTLSLRRSNEQESDVRTFIREIRHFQFFEK